MRECERAETRAEVAACCVLLLFNRSSASIREVVQDERARFSDGFEDSTGLFGEEKLGNFNVTR